MTFTVHTPQVIWFTISAIGLLLYARDHGKPKTGYDNFWLMLVCTIFNFLLLWWGGFFSQ